MIEVQETTLLKASEIREKVSLKFCEGARLVQMGCTRIGEEFQLDYTFDNNLKFSNYRVMVPAASPELESVSTIYWCAFLYENELKDLFGFKFNGLCLDFGGNFYRKKEQAPFAKVVPQIVKKPAASADGAAKGA
jgi:ech hydrogenase subunit D